MTKKELEKIEKQKLIEQKNIELQETLKVAHKMLTDIDIPVAPLENISIEVHDTARFRNIAECEEGDEEDTFTIYLHLFSIYEPMVNGEKMGSFTSILHELLHTCKYKNAYGLWSHNDLFLYYAKQIKKNYQINVLSAFPPQDYKNIAIKPLHKLVCHNCGAEGDYYSESTFKKYKDINNMGGKMKCPYCHSRVILEY